MEGKKYIYYKTIQAEERPDLFPGVYHSVIWFLSGFISVCKHTFLYVLVMAVVRLEDVVILCTQRYKHDVVNGKFDGNWHA